MDWQWVSSHSIETSEDSDGADSNSGFSFAQPAKVAEMRMTGGRPEEDDGFFIIDADAAIESLGIGAYCIGRATPCHMAKLVAVSLQAFFLEYSLLFYIVTKISSRRGTAEDRPPRLMYYIAIFLHVVNSIRSLPLAFCVALHFVRLKVTWHGLIIQGFIFVVDSFVTPSAVITIGSLYLCTSVSVSELLLNSCAVAFISTIDDWILSMHHKIKSLGGIDLEDDYELRIPHHPGFMYAMNVTICLVPVLPLAVTMLLVHVGLDVFQL